MPTGTLKMFDPDRGFGFILEDGGGDLFFHVTALHGVDPDTLSKGVRLDFDIGRGRDGRDVAKNVRHAE
jgi:CspA family cold shock protein